MQQPLAFVSAAAAAAAGLGGAAGAKIRVRVEYMRLGKVIFGPTTSLTVIAASGAGDSVRAVAPAIPLVVVIPLAASAFMPLSRAGPVTCLVTCLVRS